MKDNKYNNIREAADYIRQRIHIEPHFCVVAGTGMELSSSSFQIKEEIDYKDIPHFQSTGVKSHAGKLLVGQWHNANVMILSGRSHYYEGHSAAEVAFPVQVLAFLGVRHIFFTNAAGGVSPHYHEGDIVAIEDHINLLPDNPLRGFNDERLGLRFPDMMYTYDEETIQIFTKLAEQCGFVLRKGVYLALQGPSLETPAEYKMAYRLGADLVGMSTVPEVIAAKHAGMKVNAFSIVSNVCYPKSRLTPTTLEAVIATVTASAGKCVELLDLYFKNLKA